MASFSATPREPELRCSALQGETKAPRKMTATWEKKRCRGKGQEEGRRALGGGVAGSRVCREEGDC